MKQTSAPIWDKLNRFQKNKHAWLHVPVHGGGAGLPAELQQPFSSYARFDLTELNELDDLFHPNGIIEQAQSLAADLFGAEATYFLAGGASAGVRAMIHAVCNPHDTILIGRNAHKSLYEALVFADVIPRYLPVESLDNVPLNITAETVRDAFTRCPHAKALFLTSPSYYGVTADLAPIAEAVKKAGALLLVDEAHGGHLGFSHKLPESAGQYCDLRVQSWHKTLGALTPGAVLHCHGPSVDQRRLLTALQGVQTTSPSYPMLASLDAVRRKMALSGSEMADDMLQNAYALRRVIETSFPLLRREKVRSTGFDLDETRLTIMTAKAGICGLSVGRYLSSCGIELEITGSEYLLAIVGPGYNPEWTGRIMKALQDIPASGRPQMEVNPLPGLPDRVYTPREAYYNTAKKINLQDAADEIAADMIACYPPGIPLVLPGERITADIVRYLQQSRQDGILFYGIDHQEQVRVCR